MYVVVLCTAPPDLSREIARELIVSGLAACVNITEVRSCYLWEGAVCDDEEHLLIIKTMESKFDAVAAKIRDLHTYAVPEIIALPIAAGDPAYLDWMRQVTGR